MGLLLFFQNGSTLILPKWINSYSSKMGLFLLFLNLTVYSYSSEMDQLWKEIICSFMGLLFKMNKFFPLRTDPIKGGKNEKGRFTLLTKYPFTLKCLSIGTPNTTTFPFVSNEK